SLPTHSDSPTHYRRCGRSRSRRSTRRRVAGTHSFSVPLVSGSAEHMVATPQSWSDLPEDLAGLVLCRLCTHADRVRFAAVCPQWRFAARQVRLPPPPPLLALKRGGTFYSMPRGEPLHFTGCEEGFVTTSGNWLVYRRTRSLLLVDPFTGATMTLPAPSSVPPRRGWQFQGWL
ncbi:unnamed protein product, partial [Urochloa humidicola]